MDETTDEPQGRDEEGTFVGGSFGRPGDGAGEPSTAAQIEDEQEFDELEDEAEHVFAAGPGPAAAAEYVTQPSGSDAVPEEVEGTGDARPAEDVEGTRDTGEVADIEGITDEPSPGERNEPV